jgi:hypothetical protein
MNGTQVQVNRLQYVGTDHFWKNMYPQLIHITDAIVKGPDNISVIGTPEGIWPSINEACSRAISAWELEQMYESGMSERTTSKVDRCPFFQLFGDFDNKKLDGNPFKKTPKIGPYRMSKQHVPYSSFDDEVIFHCKVYKNGDLGEEPDPYDGSINQVAKGILTNYGPDSWIFIKAEKYANDELKEVEAFGKPRRAISRLSAQTFR